MIEFEELIKYYVDKYKPKIEDSFEIDLKDILLTSIRDKKEAPMSISIECYKSTLKANLQHLKKMEKHLGKKHSIAKIPYFTVHELAHILMYRILQKNIVEAKKTGPHSKVAVMLMRLMRGQIPYNKPFKEGFAEYVSLDRLIWLYQDDDNVKKGTIKDMIRKRKHNLNMYTDFMARLFMRKMKPYGQGYWFFNKVLDELGGDKLEDIASIPPNGIHQIKKPELYTKFFCEQTEVLKEKW